MQGLESATWEEALRAAADALSKVKGNEISFIAGKLADAETLISAKVKIPQMLVLAESGHAGRLGNFSFCQHDTLMSNTSET